MKAIFLGSIKVGKALSSNLKFILHIRNHFRNRLWKAAISSTVNDPNVENLNRPLLPPSQIMSRLSQLCLSRARSAHLGSNSPCHKQQLHGIQVSERNNRTAAETAQAKLATSEGSRSQRQQALDGEIADFQLPLGAVVRRRSVVTAHGTSAR